MNENELKWAPRHNESDQALTKGWEGCHIDPVKARGISKLAGRHSQSQKSRRRKQQGVSVTVPKGLPIFSILCEHSCACHKKNEAEASELSHPAQNSRTKRHETSRNVSIFWKFLKRSPSSPIALATKDDLSASHCDPRLPTFSQRATRMKKGAKPCACHLPVTNILRMLFKHWITPKTDTLHKRERTSAIYRSPAQFSSEAFSKNGRSRIFSHCKTTIAKEKGQEARKRCHQKRMPRERNLKKENRRWEESAVKKRSVPKWRYVENPRERCVKAMRFREGEMMSMDIGQVSAGGWSKAAVTQQQQCMPQKETIETQHWNIIASPICKTFPAIL